MNANIKFKRADNILILYEPSSRVESDMAIRYRNAMLVWYGTRIWGSNLATPRHQT